MGKKKQNEMKEMENVKYEVAQEMGIPQQKKKKKGIPGREA